MGIRETLNEKPQIVTGVSIGIIAIALIAILWQMFGGGGGGAPTFSGKVYFTTDISSDEAAMKARFAEDHTSLAPIKKDGKDAYRLIVITCDEGKTEKVAYIEKYTDEARTKILEARKQAEANKNPAGGGPPGMYAEMAFGGGQMIAIPGPKPKWVATQSAEGQEIISKRRVCPGAGPDVYPMDVNP
jgi:hypothetical protein